MPCRFEKDDESDEDDDVGYAFEGMFDGFAVGGEEVSKCVEAEPEGEEGKEDEAGCEEGVCVGGLWLFFGR